jgi:hypothetical protein
MNINQSCHSSSNTILKNSRTFLMYCMCVIEFMNKTIQFGQCFTHIYVIPNFNINFIHNGFRRKFSRKFIGLGGSHKRFHELCILFLTSPHTPIIVPNTFSCLVLHFHHACYLKEFFFFSITLLGILLPLLCHLASPKTSQDALQWGLHKNDACTLKI